MYYAPDSTALASFTMLKGGIRGNSVPVGPETFGGECCLCLRNELLSTLHDCLHVTLPTANGTRSLQYTNQLQTD